MRLTSHFLCFVLLAVAVTASGCGRSAPKGPAETALAGFAAPALLWEAKTGAEAAVPMIVLCAEGSEPKFWNLLASAASNEGYQVLVCPPIPGRDAKALLDAAMLRLGGPAPEKCVVAAETEPAGELLALAARGMPLGAMALLSPTLGTSAEEQAKQLGGTPLLLVACENDTQGITGAHRLKDAATGYCEIQTYACGVRGVDVLAAAPSLARQLLAWLKPIMKAEKP